MPKPDHPPAAEQARPPLHQPVLIQPVLQYLAPRPGQSYLDATAGYGGHAGAVLARTAAPGKAVLIDRDPAAAEYLRKHLDGARIINKDFLSASQDLADQGGQFDLILVDLGISSPHLDNAARGFSIARVGPLDMRMDDRQTLTAGDIVNQWSQPQLAELLRQYGQEPKAERIASLIVERRPLSNTRELAVVAELVWPHGRTHPATRTFQALRIAVNDELNQLKHALPLWTDLLAPAGRLVIISFHSLEDGLVKHFLAEHSGAKFDAQLDLLTKKPIRPSATEIVANPRSRSARLRAAAKIKTTERIKGNSNADNGEESLASL